MTTKIAVFDFDGTITRTDTIKFLLASLLLHRPIKFFGVCLLYGRFFRGKIGIQQFKSKAIGLLIHNKTPVTVNRMLGIYRTLATRYFRTLVHDKFADLCNQDYRVVIATASPDFAVKFVLNSSAIEVIGTTFDVQNGKYTGKLSGDVCLGQEKAQRLVKHLGPDQKIAVAFSDGDSDLAMLNLAEKAYLVGSDGELKTWK